ncbi:MAG: Ppx/GppA phosphatase family protein [Methylovulum sp.]|uniref:Ppx/GppA phosphatase family protein n=1 Tax=Methylovulum sp. TaxID=1916980 RepID=UPI002603759C|nr:Ppx/GppA phosphatase family protein [Methylovulum sp.]MDD2725362.1 Ppx/GppA phosphatase family protein [Methylovulum sp.]MDD5124457.1 Ppx/GppA phosphatase family protein [Methylovulum sp.]
MQKKPPEIVAAVDLGSNSFHMLVCSLSNGKLITLDQLKEMVRLASGLDKDNVLDLPTQFRALACLERFGQRIRNFPPESVRIVGTNTLRAAKNAPQFIAQAEKALNHPIHIISGIEEARLIYQGVAFSLGTHGDLRLVMDIGGGSTEYIIGSGENPLNKESLHMGCVSVSNWFFPGGKLSKEAFTKAVVFAQQQLEPIETKFQSNNWDEAVGASGSLKAIANVLAAKNWSNNGITRTGLDLLVNHVNQCTHINELNLPELDDERLPVFVGGLAIAYATFKSLNIVQMTVSDGALREGLIQDLLGRIYDHDIRSATTQNLVERYHTDRQHAARIKQTVEYILDNATTQRAFVNDEDCRQFIKWAADLHEIGQDIAHSQYHKHSAYIIENGDLAGFSKQDQILLATIIRSHRRRFSFSRFLNLPAPWNQYAPYLTLILRLAVLLRRNRHDENLPEFKINLTKSKMVLKFPEGWLAQSPLTHADLAQEAGYLKEAGFILMFS